MSRVKHIADGVTLYLGDCLTILPSLPPVAAVMADAPYEKEAHKTGRRTMAQIKTGENADLDFDAITPEERITVAKLTTEICRGWSLFFCQAEAAGDWRDALEAAKAKYKRTMVWIKPDSSPQFNGQMPAPGYESMPLAWCGQGHPRWNGGGRRGVFTHLTNQPTRHGVHKTEKPVSLMVELVDLFTNPGDTICDPYMGSGTTGVAAVQRGRKFIGIELNETFFDIACKRISEALKQQDFFVEKPKPAEQLGWDEMWAKPFDKPEILESR